MASTQIPPPGCFQAPRFSKPADGLQGTRPAWAEHPNAIHFLQPCVQPRCRCTLRTSLQAISQSWFSRPAFNPLLTALWLCSHFPFAGHQFVLALLPVRISPHNFQILAFLHLQGHSPPMLSSQVTTGEILSGHHIAVRTLRVHTSLLALFSLVI